MLLALRQDGWALAFASEALCEDRGVALAAVQEVGLSLYFASEALRVYVAG